MKEAEIKTKVHGLVSQLTKKKAAEEADLAVLGELLAEGLIALTRLADAAEEMVKTHKELSRNTAMGAAR